MPKNLKTVSLDDKYTLQQGRILVSGTQALVRLPLLQRQLDRQQQINSAGFISGYRGSPLGNYDTALWRERPRLAAAGIHFKPGVNEDLAATAVWGTQQLDNLPDKNVAGVFALWYGKGPGVDRCGDVFKHANYTGTHRYGGVLLVYGDDHPGKSSTVAHQSEQALAANQIPSLYPSNVQEFIDYGLLGWALSRYSGLWVGFKCVNETVEQTATVDIDNANIDIVTPNSATPAASVNYLPGFQPPLRNEMAVKRERLPRVHSFVRANRIDRQTLGCSGGGLGIVTAGKSYQDVRQALKLLDIDDHSAETLGLSIYKVGCIWPLEPQGIKAFSRHRKALLFVEEKNGILENQTREILYNLPQRPPILGKQDIDGKPLLPSDVMLEPLQIARVIVDTLDDFGLASTSLSHSLSQQRTLLERGNGAVRIAEDGPSRLPYFCSGCPHNRSTKLPEGSLAMAGIGCHAMTVHGREDTLYPTHMGGEGMNWAGLSTFTDIPHIFQNLGDGTYYHSGLLAIRGAVAANVNITYKILYNDAVAMTGGQAVDGPLSVGEISHQVLHEGVKRCVVVTDSPNAYNSDSGLAEGVRVYHRDQLDTVQRELREIPGCTVLIYEQTCAAEKRRRRKRQQFPDPAKRLFINAAVCEGCGDCSAQSTCVSLLPKETDFGIKRQIDQSGCNKDYSCAKGFCPSFVTVQGGKLRKTLSSPQQEASLNELLADGQLGSIPDPAPLSLTHGSYNIMLAGIGGTGITTASALLSMAAHLEGKTVCSYDMTGLSQKNGAVYSHLRIAENAEAIAAPRLGEGEAHLVVAFDMIAALKDDAEKIYAKQTTNLVANSFTAPTANFQFDPNDRPDTRHLQQQLEQRIKRGHFIQATEMALLLCGDAIAANLLLLGYTVQLGLLPISVNAIATAIELNGVAVSANQRAFNLGRLWASQPEKLKPFLTKLTAANAANASNNNNDNADSAAQTPRQKLDQLLASRIRFLTGYQDKKYAQRYRTLVDKVHQQESQLGFAELSLTLAVAKYYAKLLAYKDEYEVARLYASADFLKQLSTQFEGAYKLKFNLAPPLLSKRDPQSGQLIKREFGGWLLPVFKMLKNFKRLRGTPFDIFGHTEERRQERRLIRDYEALVESLVGGLTDDNHRVAVQLAELPEHIRGFGHVKERHIDRVKKRQAQLLNQFNAINTGVKTAAGHVPIKIIENRSE